MDHPKAYTGSDSAGNARHFVMFSKITFTLQLNSQEVFDFLDKPWTQVSSTSDPRHSSYIQGFQNTHCSAFSARWFEVGFRQLTLTRFRPVDIQCTVPGIDI